MLSAQTPKPGANQQVRSTSTFCVQLETGEAAGGRGRAQETHQQPLATGTLAGTRLSPPAHHHVWVVFWITKRRWM